MKRKIRRFICTAMIFIMAVTSFDCTGMPGKVQAADNENDYPAVLALALDFFDENACGGDVGTLGVSWRGNCHTYDNEAALDKADNFPEQYRSLVDPDGDGKVDVSGGYHDAGDHVKFNLTMGFAGSSLALSEYLNPGVYEKAGAKAHLLKIVKRNADYLMKTTFLDGNGDVAAVCHVVGNGNTDHSIWSSPESQTYERTTYWLNAERNNTAVCCEMAAAIASAGWLYKDTDAEYTAKCVKYAKALLKFGKEHQGNDLGGLSTFYNTDGYYGSETMYGLDETAMAEAWLWVLGEGEKPGYTPDSGCYIYQGVYYGDYDFYSWNKVWQGFAALMYKATGEQAYAQALKDAYTNKQGLSASYYNDFGIEWGVSRYNCAMQMTALALANKDAASDYAKAAKYQMDYILGANTYNYSFVIGYGTNPKYIHHRAANPDQAEAKYVLKGALLGGPDKNGYKDDVHSYQYTESALDYSGCLALACAGLAELYGGSGSSSSGDETPEEPTPSDPLPGGSSAKDPQPELTNEKEQSITLVKGQKFLLSDKDWKSSDKKIVSVSGKTVTAKKPGSTGLIFGNGEEEYKINITVIAPQIAKNEKKQKLSVGQSVQLKLSGVTAADGSIIFTGNEPMDILFYSSAPDVALVDDSGNINAVSKGSATITAYINSVAFKWTVKVSEDTAPEERTLHINVGKSKAVKIKGIKNTEWTVSGDNIVQIKKAKITAKEVGETTLTCEDHVLHVFVEDPSISGSSKPYKQQLSLDTGAEHPIELARIYQEVQFKSSKPVVAFADEDGVIHARSKGKTNITAKVNGKTVTIKLTVK